MGNRQVVERYARALAEDDLEGQVALLHPEYVGRYPQSGEVIRGPEAFRAVAEHYPGHDAAPLTVTASAIQGADDQYLMGPSWAVVHVAGSDDEYTLAGQIRYPNGETWHGVAMLTLKGGKIWRETDYFAAPFDVPDWRRPFVEVEDPEAAGHAMA